MAIRHILLDTIAYTAFKGGASDAIDIVEYAPLIGMNSIVLGELLSGFAVGTQESANLAEFRQFLDTEGVRLFSVDDVIARYYAIINRDLRQKGRPIPTNDMWIAATALQHGLALFSYDSHMQVVDGLTVGSRLADFVV